MLGDLGHTPQKFAPSEIESESIFNNLAKATYLANMA